MAPNLEMCSQIETEMIMVYYAEQDSFGNDVIVTVSSDYIVSTFYPSWRDKMVRLGRKHMITVDNCIRDFLTVNLGWKN